MKAKKKPVPVNPWHQLSDKIESAILKACQDHKNPVTTLRQLYEAASASFGESYGYLDTLVFRLAKRVREHVKLLLVTGKIVRVGKRYIVPNVGAEE